MALNAEKIKRLVRGILTTRDDELGCADCFEQVDRFVELHLQGVDISQAMPLVKDHLNRCGDCREEFEALLEAVGSGNSHHTPARHLEFD